MEKDISKDKQGKSILKSLNNKGGCTVLEKPKVSTIKKTNDKEKTTGIKPTSTKFPGTGKTLGGSEFEESKKTLDELVDIYSGLGK